MKDDTIQQGIGFSKVKDSYKAGKEAATAAIKGLGGKKPTISFVFYEGPYDPKELNEAFIEVFNGTEFVGGSTDAVIYKTDIVPCGVVVCSLYSEYLHVGVASADNVRKDPYGIAKKTVIEAVRKISVDKYLDSYMQFARMKKGDLTSLTRIPSFFTFLFTRGYEQNNMGNEDIIIQGTADAIGHYIPIFGGSLGNDMDKVFKQEPYEIYTFHSGKIFTDGLAVVFAYSGLAYSNSISHGGEPMGKLGYISKVTGGGFVVQGICDKPIKSWYAETLGIPLKKFESNILFYTQKYPLGFPDGYGNIVMRAGGVPFKDDLSYIAPFKENTPVWVMNIEADKLIVKAPQQIQQDIDEHLGRKIRPFSTFVVSCASRRRVLDPKSSKRELETIAKMSKGPLWGFCSFGEIGARPAETCHYNHLCTNLFNFYSELLTNL